MLFPGILDQFCPAMPWSNSSIRMPSPIPSAQRAFLSTDHDVAMGIFLCMNFFALEFLLFSELRPLTELLFYQSSVCSYRRKRTFSAILLHSVKCRIILSSSSYLLPHSGSYNSSLYVEDRHLRHTLPLLRQIIGRWTGR